jgi:hypothetical protein
MEQLPKQLMELPRDMKEQKLFMKAQVVVQEQLCQVEDLETVEDLDHNLHQQLKQQVVLLLPSKQPVVDQQLLQKHPVVEQTQPPKHLLVDLLLQSMEERLWPEDVVFTIRTEIYLLATN